MINRQKRIPPIITPEEQLILAKGHLKLNNMINIDLYTANYLGELESTIIEKNNADEIVSMVRLFSADFNSIIDWIPYDESSNHESLVYLFNTNLDWGDNFDQILRLQEFYDQLIIITNQVPPHPLGLPVLDSLKQICSSALQNGNELFVKISH